MYIQGSLQWYPFVKIYVISIKYMVQLNMKKINNENLKIT